MRRAAFAPVIVGAPVVVTPRPSNAVASAPNEPAVLPRGERAAASDVGSPSPADDAQLVAELAPLETTDEPALTDPPPGVVLGGPTGEAGPPPGVVLGGPTGEAPPESEEGSVAPPLAVPPRVARVDWRYLVPFVLLLPAVLAAVYAASIDPNAPDFGAAALAKVSSAEPEVATGSEGGSASVAGSAPQISSGDVEGPDEAVSGAPASVPAPRHRPGPRAIIEDELKKGCTTAVVRGLSEQIIAESNCIAPGTFAKVPDLKNLKLGEGVFPYLAVPARDALIAALKSSKRLELHVSSMLRTIPQQYLLYSWYQQGRCGITLASLPGESNHQSGMALDISNFGDWRKPLTQAGFQWLGKQDKWHFDYKKAVVAERPGLDVLAFQRLWNRNHADDRIPETGAFDSGTEARLRRSPLAGFPAGASCSARHAANASAAMASAAAR